MTIVAEHASPEVVNRVESFMLSLIDRNDEPVWMTLRSIADNLGIGRTTAHKAINELVASGRVRLVRCGTGKGYPNRYDRPK